MDRHDRILDAAVACIGRVGLAKTTLDDVAREAGCARATVYRTFSSKQRLIAALVGREAEAIQRRVLDAAAAADGLGPAITATITTGASALRAHPALAFVAAHEEDAIFPYLAFDGADALMRHVAQRVAPAFEAYLPREQAVRLGEWIARVTLSYLLSPSDDLDIGEEADVRALVDDFVLPGFAGHTQGVTR